MKKILIILCLFALALPQLPVKKTEASTEDSPYSFTVTTSNPVYSFTGYRLKGDDSSVYLKPKTMTNTLSKVYVVIYGAANNTGAGEKNCTYKNRHYYYTRSNLYNAYEVYNTVFEDKEVSHAALGIEAASGSGSTSGVWSPDTAGSFPELNYQ